MTWRVAVEPDFARDGVAVHLGDRYDGFMFPVQPMEFVTERIEGVGVTPLRGPALRLPDDLGRALLNALARHYGGAVDARTSREDLLAERKRSDRLIEALISITARPPTG